MSPKEEEPLYNQKIVTIGGGTGHFTLLRGLVKYNNPELITAIPATWDSGGSSGGLRVKEGILPPGDYMQCLLALMEDEEQLQEAITILRDRSGGDPLVNLLATRAEKAHHGVVGGIDGLRKLFRVRGKVVPVSTVDLDLYAKTRLGNIIEYEHEIDEKKNDGTFNQEDEISRIYFSTKAPANPEALQAIKEANLIIFSAGSPFTSRYAHLLVDQISQTIMESEAQLIMIDNLMTTGGEDHHLHNSSQHIAIQQHYLGDDESVALGKLSRINVLIANDNHIDEQLIKLYASEGQNPIVLDEDECKRIAPGIDIIRKRLATYDRTSHLLRHDPDLLARTILQLPVTHFDKVFSA